MSVIVKSSLGSRQDSKRSPGREDGPKTELSFPRGNGYPLLSPDFGRMYMAYPADLLGSYKVLEDPNQCLHRTVKDIVASYNSAWDPLTELLQNSIDGINTRAALDGGAYEGKLLITIDATTNSIVIEDNGIGIPPGKANTLLLPGGSLKTLGNTYGHKGLGFTYCAHVSRAIEVETEHHETGAKDHWKFSGAFEWLVDASKTPVMEKVLNGSLRTMQGPGTAVRVEFVPGQYEPNVANTAVLDDFFKWADDEKLLPFVLRTRTAIGQVGTLFNEAPPVNVDVKVAFVNGSRSISVPYSFFDFQTKAPLSQQNYPRASDYASKIYLNPKYPNKTHYGIYHIFATEASDPAKTLSVGRVHGGVTFSAYIYACGKENLATALSQYDERLGENGPFRNLAFTTDVHLAIAGMPSGVPIDSWNNFGAHEQRYFSIVNTELSFGSVLDAGRKTITRYYVDLITQKIVDLTKAKAAFGGQVSFYELSTHLHTRPGAPTRTPISYIEQWKTYPALKTDRLLLTRRPDDELGTYLLFGELAGRGHLPGYKFLYLSGGAVYDAAVEFEINLQNLEHLNQSAGGKNKFGVGQPLIQQQKNLPSFPKYKWRDQASGQEHLVTEFKVAAEELLRDVQKQKTAKQIRDINLLVCIQADEGEIINLQGSWIPVSDAARRLSGVTHELSYAGHTIPVICLDEVINELSKIGAIK